MTDIMTMLRTASGRRVDILHPTLEMFDVWDIAQGLAHTCRFHGQIDGLYSVAQHCVVVADTVLKHTSDPRLALCGLLHDVAEAYLFDASRVIKTHIHVEIDGAMRPIEYLERLYLSAVAVWAGLPWPFPDVVWAIDNSVGDAEDERFEAGQACAGWDAREAADEWMSAYHHYHSLIRINEQRAQAAEASG